ncbi:MAG TPA: helix-turn-helix transcriptional regulator [Streptosporangiaceae bacterium]|nr:helix-turn-helix transcriptional regulator [Streptosporangiaceae bacterium]
MDRSPIVRGRRLMRELRRLRESSGLDPDEAAERLGFSRSKLYRIENGRTRVGADDLEDMLSLYGVGSPERESLMRLGRESRRRGWWTRYRDVLPGPYVGLEAEASSTQVWTCLIPGLFQTTAYARAVITATGPWLSESEVERRVAARADRQEEFFGCGRRVRVHAVIDESALLRPIGGAVVMHEQLDALLASASRPEVTIQVLAFSTGGCAGIDGDFVILRFPEAEDPPVVYVEGMFGGLYLEAGEGVDRYALAWAQLTSRALSPEESLVMIKNIAEDER